MKNNKNTWGGEIAYSAPTLEELNVAVENGFAASGNPWEAALSDDASWDYASDEFE